MECTYHPHHLHYHPTIHLRPPSFVRLREKNEREREISSVCHHILCFYDEIFRGIVRGWNKAGGHPKIIIGRHKSKN